MLTILKTGKKKHSGVGRPLKVRGEKKATERLRVTLNMMLPQPCFTTLVYNESD